MYREAAKSVRVDAKVILAFGGSMQKLFWRVDANERSSSVCF